MNEAERRALEARLLKDLRPQATQDPRELAPEPPMLMFKAYRIDVPVGVDPVSGRKITNLVITSGNYAIQVIVPLPSENVAALIRELEKGLGPVQEGVPSVDALAGDGDGGE